MERFREAVESGDIDAALDLLSEDAVFRSPVVYAPYHGRATIDPLLRTVVKVLQDFRYTRHIGHPGGADHALVFEARVGDREIEGCDFLHVNDEGQIDELFVMVRPFSAAVAVSEAMQEQLASATAG